MVTILAIITSLAVALGASGQGKGTGFATVDFKKLSNGYKAREAVDAELKTMQKQYEDKLQRRNNMPFLTEDEQKQLDALYEKTPVSDADKTKIAAIENKAKAKSAKNAKGAPTIALPECLTGLDLLLVEFCKNSIGKIGTSI